jgi:hypothetical protein
MTFYDETLVRLRVRDELTGREWGFPIETHEGPFEYATAASQMTSRLPLVAFLPARTIQILVDELTMARRLHDRPMEAAAALGAILDGSKCLLSRGGDLLKFVPDFQVRLM